MNFKTTRTFVITVKVISTEEEVKGTNHKFELRKCVGWVGWVGWAGKGWCRLCGLQQVTCHPPTLLWRGCWPTQAASAAWAPSRTSTSTCPRDSASRRRTWDSGSTTVRWVAKLSQEPPLLLYTLLFSKYQIYVSQHMTQYFLTGSYLGHISGNNFVLIETVLKMYWAYVLYEHIWHIRTVSAGES